MEICKLETNWPYPSKLEKLGLPIKKSTICTNSSIVTSGNIVEIIDFKLVKAEICGLKKPLSNSLSMVMSFK
jgi:hypothetical protein